MSESRLSLRARLAGTMGALFLGGTVVMYVAARVYGQTAADRSYDRLLVGSALSIIETLSASDREIQVDLPYAALDMLSSAPEDRVFYRVAAPDGRTVTGYDDLPVGTGQVRQRGTPAHDQPRFFDAQYRGELVRFAVLGREIAEPGVRGWVSVQVGQTRRAREALAHELVLGALVPIALMTVLALAFVWFGISRALRPLARIGNDLSRRRPEDLHPVAAPVPAEVAPVVEAINGFMQRLSANINTLRAFIAEAAHQMRTPLAALRLQAQVAADDDPEELRHSLRAVERNAAKLSRLLNQLLSDATIMHRSDVRRFEAFDLVPLVRSALREAVPVAADVQVGFSSDLDEAPYVGDALMLGEAVKNLVDNALRHGYSDEDDVAVRLVREGGHYVIGVADRGQGIPVALRERVFERFAHGDSTRPGAGLGLAIVRQAIEAQGGTITIVDRDGGGIEMQVHLPVERT
ncbi:sensor histidine kinase [Dokdonella sp. MW10]|uniref:sensor histidine kinase n=1 Tax=Dokdonella sp. MW10 TaxID=2992926 RepID=UPI003F7FF485